MACSPRQPARSLVRSLLVMLVLIGLPGCLTDGAITSDRVPEARFSPSMTPAPASATPSIAQQSPTSIPASPTSTIPAPTTTIEEGAPEGQEVDLPEVDLVYEIDAVLTEFNAGQVEAVSSVEVTNREDDPLEGLFFRVAPAQYDFFTLHGVVRDGEPVEVIASDAGTTLEISLDPALAPGATTTLRFDFTLDLAETTNGYSTTSRDGPVLRLGYWYPMLSNDAGFPPVLDPAYTRTADFHVSLTAPKDVVVAAGGAPASLPKFLDDGVRYRWTLEQGRDFALMMSPEYVVDQRTTSDGIVVELFTVPSLYGSGAPGLQEAQRDRAFAAAERALAEYAERVGPYPWPSLTIAEGGPDLGGGIEFTALTAITFGSSAIEVLVAHEVAHMWFYAAVGTRTQDDPWLDEGAATFLAEGMLFDYSSLDRDATTDYVAPLNASVYDLSAFATGAWVASVYTQGGQFYADVYATMGADAFWDAMQEIYDTQAFEIATPWEVLSIFQQHSPADLRPLFDDYFTYEWIDSLS